MITQLIMDGEVMPESRDGGYIIERKPLSVSVEMATGRLVNELKGTVLTGSYQYGYFDDEKMKRIIAICEKGQREPIWCGVLTQENAPELEYSWFWITAYKRPKFLWGKNKSDGTIQPMWADFSVQFREVEPHD